MSKISTPDELDCDDLKPFCVWEGAACTCGPNGPIMCEGRYCEEAYEKWYAQHAVTCEVCKQIVDIDKCNTVIDMRDGSKHFVCEDCEEESARHDNKL